MLGRDPCVHVRATDEWMEKKVEEFLKTKDTVQLLRNIRRYGDRRAEDVRQEVYSWVNMHRYTEGGGDVQELVQNLWWRRSERTSPTLFVKEPE
jgi:hypothetical protein